MSDESELAELLAQDPNREAARTCWSALARVVDDDPTFVYGDGDESGMTVKCMILTGPFAGAEVPAMVSCPLGSGTELNPLRGGNRVLLQFMDGNLDGLIVATASVPGGAENPLPKAMAGIAVTEEGLKTNRLVKPGKRVNLRFYIEGAAFLVRLKGAQEGFAGELYIEADDAKNSPDGKNGTFVRIVRDASGSFGIKARTAEGAYVNLLKDTVSASSPSAESQIIISDEAVDITAKVFRLNAGTAVMNGTFLVNMPPLLPPLPIRAAFVGPTGVAGVPSTSFFIGT